MNSRGIIIVALFKNVSSEVHLKVRYMMMDQRKRQREYIILNSFRFFGVMLNAIYLHIRGSGSSESGKHKQNSKKTNKK